ncbi:MAG: helix-turn-helix domain-containing protein [Actinomycetota bacterium]|nr:helix-turn-helix domain-containing protein [Actinomycetota bacterium]
MTPTVITEPAAIVAGSAAALLSRWFRTPQVAALMRASPWLPGPDVAEALRGIHQAACAWEATVELRERNTVVRHELPGPNHATLTTEEASQRLGIGPRRVQQLAQRGRITGRRVGRKWELDVRSVYQYQQKRAPAA